MRSIVFQGRAFLGPPGGQRGGNQRQEQLVMAGDGIAPGFRSAAAGGGHGRTLHYIFVSDGSAE